MDNIHKVTGSIIKRNATYPVYNRITKNSEKKKKKDLFESEMPKRSGGRAGRTKTGGLNARKQALEGHRRGALFPCR